MQQNIRYYEGVVVVDTGSPEGQSIDSAQIGTVKVVEFDNDVTDLARDGTSFADLPNVKILMPSTSTSSAGIGNSPPFIREGTRVICMEISSDEGSQHYLIGTLHYAPDGNHTVSPEARGLGEPEQKTKLRIEGKDGSIIEPKSEYKAEYPYNQTMKTSSGHLVEFDDTTGAERIHIYHKSGSYIEILPDGTIVTKSVKDHIQLAFGNISIYSNGNEGGEKDIEITSNQGKVIIAAEKDVDIFADNGNVGIFANSGSVNVVSKSGVINTSAPRIGLNADAGT